MLLEVPLRVKQLMCSILSLAGPEISVATTKAYSAQLIATYLIAMQFAKVRGDLKDNSYNTMLDEIQKLPGKVERVIEDKERL